MCMNGSAHLHVVLAVVLVSVLLVGPAHHGAIQRVGARLAGDTKKRQETVSHMAYGYREAARKGVRLHLFYMHRDVKTK